MESSAWGPRHMPYVEPGFPTQVPLSSAVPHYLGALVSSSVLDAHYDHL